MLAIRVHGDHNIALRSTQASREGGLVAKIAAEFDDLDRRVFGCKANKL